LHTFNKTIIFKALCFLKIEDCSQQEIINEKQHNRYRGGGGNAVIGKKADSRFAATKRGNKNAGILRGFVLLLFI